MGAAAKRSNPVNNYTHLVKETSAHRKVVRGVCGKYRGSLISAVYSQHSSTKSHYSICDRNRGIAGNKTNYFFIYISQKIKRQTVVDQIDNPRRHESPHHLGEGIGHEPRPGHLPQNTETQGHRWVQMGTCRDVGHILEEEYRRS